MQSGPVEIPNHGFQTNITHLSQPTTAQHGPGRSRSSLPGACSLLRARSTSSGAESVGAGGLDVGQLDQDVRRLSVAEDKLAAGSRDAVAGKRIADYENAAICSFPRHNTRPALAFKVANGPQSDSVHLTDFPNGSLPAGGVVPSSTACCGR